MLIALHVIIALASIVFAAYAMFSPSKAKLNISYTFIGATFISGTYLIITMPAHMIQACLEGLLYLGVVSIATVLAHKKLATESREE